MASVNLLAGWLLSSLPEDTEKPPGKSILFKIPKFTTTITVYLEQAEILVREHPVSLGG
jgi:hypothetical protein